MPLPLPLSLDLPLPGVECVGVKPLQVSLARCVRNNLHSHQEFINCLWQLPWLPLLQLKHLCPVLLPIPTPSLPYPATVNVRRHNLIKPGQSQRRQAKASSMLPPRQRLPSSSPPPAPSAHSRQHPIDCINVFLQNYCLPRRACLS